ncbi:MAG: hydrogenase maturation protease [Desulfobulbaceae bacterium]|nr:MAG: hydrogenase maturation protease [Desulfobulbaceae bacterium]
MAKALVVCIGNDLVADDAVGYQIYNRLLKHALPEEVRVLLLGVGGMALIEELKGEQLLVVVDAVQLGSPAGTIHVLDWEQIPGNDLRPVSGHGIGVREALQVCRRLYPERAAEDIYLVGIEGSCFDQVGAPLTKGVEDALPDAVSEILRLLETVSSPDAPAD